jgi:hypothetical protein
MKNHITKLLKDHNIDARVLIVALRMHYLVAPNWKKGGISAPKI